MKLQLLRDQYARALRVIGQDVADLLTESLTIEMSGDDFVARGCGKAEISASKNNQEGRLTRNIWRKLSQPFPKAQPPRSTFVRTYTADAINKLDEIGRARRTSSAQRPDLDSVAERLRMIGRIVDEKNGALVNLSQDANSVTFQYRDTQGEIHSEEYSTLTLYKLQQQYYSGRCFQPKDAWQAVPR
jgi:hypothetical protein